MKLLIYEHLTSGALCHEPLPEDLVREGNAMAQALLDDLADCPEVKPIVLRDSRLGAPANAYRCYYSGNRDEFRHHWAACLDSVDGVLPIAPESDSLLAGIQERVLGAGKRLLGCRPEATRIAASKTRSNHYLAAAGLATLPTVWLTDWHGGIFNKGPLICKPDDGAGCHQVLYFTHAAALTAWRQTLSPQGRENLIVQPYIAGVAASLCLLCAEGKVRLLCQNQQQIQMKGNALSLRGIIVNTLANGDPSILQAVAATIARTFPGLWGFVGVDLIFSQGQPVVVEINPRLTTSYAGLRKAFGENPATWLLTLLNHGMTAIKPPPPLDQEVFVSLEPSLAVQTSHC